MNTTRNALRHYCWNTSTRNIMNMCIKRDWYNAGSSVAYEHMLDFVRDNETIEDDNGKYLDVVEHIAKDIYEHTDIDDNSDFSATDVACAIMNEATIHYCYWESPEY